MSEAAVKTAAWKSRPKYLNLQALLFEIRLPLPGWISILHRISGALLFMALVWLLWMLDGSLASEAGFERIQRYASLAPVKLALLARQAASSIVIPERGGGMGPGGLPGGGKIKSP